MIEWGLLWQSRGWSGAMVHSRSTGTGRHLAGRLGLGLWTGQSRLQWNSVEPSLLSAQHARCPRLLCFQWLLAEHETHRGYLHLYSPMISPRPHIFMPTHLKPQMVLSRVWSNLRKPLVFNVNYLVLVHYVSSHSHTLNKMLLDFPNLSPRFSRDDSPKLHIHIR
jgi:hypothetical protein